MIVDTDIESDTKSYYCKAQFYNKKSTNTKDLQ